MFTNRLNILSHKQHNVKKGDHILTEKELLSFLKNIEKAEKEAREKTQHSYPLEKNEG